MIKVYKFNHRLLDYINTGHTVYMPALNWAMRDSYAKQTVSGMYDGWVNSAEIYFTHSINYETAEVFVSIYRKTIMEGSGWDPKDPLVVHKEFLPCHDQGPSSVASVMQLAKKVAEDHPARDRLAAAATIVRVLNGICVAHLKHMADRISQREHASDLHNDRYQLSYEEV